MDILIMSDNNLETVGGEQESSKIIINGLKSKFNIGVIQPGIIKKQFPNVKYYKLTESHRIKHLIRSPFSFLNYILKVKRIINSSNPKIIHTQAQVSFFIVSLLKKFKMIPNNVKIIHTERGLYTKYSPFFKKIFMYFIKELDTLVTTTEFNMKYWKEAIEKKNITINYKVIENTAGEIFESYDPTLTNQNREELIIGFAGRYCDWKNWPLAIKICEELNKSFKTKLKVKMAVGCLDKNSEEETIKMFEQMKSNIGENFIGTINIDLIEMDKFYYELDFFILTSNYNTESFGRTLVEAMSRETIVLSTNAGGSVEVVGNTSNILETPSEFADKITDFFNNPEKMKQEKRRNLKRVRENYSLENNISKHIKLYLGKM